MMDLPAETPFTDPSPADRPTDRPSGWLASNICISQHKLPLLVAEHCTPNKRIGKSSHKFKKINLRGNPISGTSPIQYQVQVAVLVLDLT